jgi:carboxymethylenebutenolidase
MTGGPADQPPGFLAAPAAGKGRPVLVLHAWWGLNETIKGLCKRLAQAGFTAFAPDLYGGKVTDTLDGAEALAAALEADPLKAKADVRAAAQFLAGKAGASGSPVAVIGFSLGAFYALDLAATSPDIVGSVVLFYGTGSRDPGRSRAAYLGHFAERDPFEPQAEVDRLGISLAQAGRPVTFHVYPGTGHWFFEPDRTDAFNPAAAALAWDRTLAFLGGSGSTV